MSPQDIIDKGLGGPARGGRSISPGTGKKTNALSSIGFGWDLEKRSARSREKSAETCAEINLRKVMKNAAVRKRKVLNVA